MNHNEIVRQVSERIDRLEAKIDPFIEQVVENKKDIAWTTGSIKLGITLTAALITAVITVILNHYI